MQTHAERFRLLMQEWNLTQEELGILCGLKRGTVGTIVNGRTTPDVEALVRLKQARPEINWDWLLLGTGPMLRDGRALTAAPPPAYTRPINGLVSQAATVAEAENILLRELLESKNAVIEILKAELGKSPGSADAAAYVHYPTPRPTIGFGVAHATQVAADFGAYCERMERVAA
jgi:transcriptional regulator with XRE-family HTH domain